MTMKHICDPLFRMNFLFSDAPTVEAYKKEFKTWNGIETEANADLGGRFEGLTTIDGFERGIIWAPNKELDVLTHEICHAVQWALETRRDTPLCNETSEVYAYYTQFLMKEILSDKINKAIKIREDLPDATPKKRRQKPKKSRVRTVEKELPVDKENKSAIHVQSTH